MQYITYRMFDPRHLYVRVESLSLEIYSILFPSMFGTQLNREHTILASNIKHKYCTLLLRRSGVSDLFL